MLPLLTNTVGTSLVPAMVIVMSRLLVAELVPLLSLRLMRYTAVTVSPAPRYLTRLFARLKSQATVPLEVEVATPGPLMTKVLAKSAKADCRSLEMLLPADVLVETSAALTCTRSVLSSSWKLNVPLVLSAGETLPPITRFVSSLTLPLLTTAVIRGWSLLPVIVNSSALLRAVALPSLTRILPKLSLTFWPAVRASVAVALLFKL